ncbi:hypothetical protein MMC15_002690 [Xylographa vitiligo]|nr:hypothetical protein [Xylographa vitiligo]
MDAKTPLLPTAHAHFPPTRRLTPTQRFLHFAFHLCTAIILLLALLSVFGFGVYCAVTSDPADPSSNSTTALTTTLLPRSLSHPLTSRFLPPNSTLPPIPGRCNIHVYQSPYFMTPDIASGSLWVRVTDGSDREIGHLDWTDWNTANGPTAFEVPTRVGGVGVEVRGFDVLFRMGAQEWAVEDSRCRLGDWDRVVFLKWDLRRPDRQMDCGFAC